MKKTILLFAMLIAVVGVKAQSVHKLYATPTQVSGNGNISWDESTNTFTVTAAGSNTYQIFEFPEGTLSNYKKIHINISNTNDRVLFMSGSTSSVSWQGFSSAGLKDVELSSISGLSSAMASITSIRIGGPGSGGAVNGNISMDPAQTWLETDAYEGMDITTTITSSSDNSNPFVWKKSGDGTVSVNNYMSTGDNGIIFGYNAASYSDASGFFDITGYNRARTTISSFNSSNSKEVRLIYGSSNLVIASCIDKTTKYEKLLSSLSSPKMHSIKSGAGASSAQLISSIAFTKNFNAASTTAFAIAASTSSNVAYDRTFTVGQDATVCLPFALTDEEAAEAGDFYEFTGVSGTTLTFSKVTITTAYKPYIFKAKKANPFANLTNKAIEASAGQSCEVTHDGYTFKGTLAHQNVPTDAYGFSATDGSFVKATSSAVTINAFRAYITSTSGARSLDVDFGDGTTGIEKVKNVGNKYDSIYNLSGQSVSPNYKGIVIKNGKKMIQK